MAYFSTLAQNDTLDMYTVFTAINRISGGIFFPVILLTVFFVWILGSVFAGKPIHRAVLYGSFICSIFSMLMVLMNFLAPTYMYFAFFMTAVGLIWTRLAESYS